MNRKILKNSLSDPLYTALLIGLLFFIFSMLWIPVSERIIHSWIKSPIIIDEYEEHIKVLFRLILSFALFVLIRQILIQLKKANERAQKYLDVADVILVALNAKGEIKLINPKGCRLLGVKEDEVMGKNWFDLFVSTEERGKARSRFHQLVGGYLKDYEYMEGKIRSLDGRDHLIAWHHSVLKDEKGRIIEILSSGEDISEQRKLEKEVLEIREKEQQRIGQDLHDSLGQNLTAVTYMTQLLQKRLGSRGLPEAQDVSEVVKLVGKSIDQVRGLARGLYPNELSKSGLVPALQDLASTLEFSHSVSCSVVVNGTAAVEDEAIAIQLYRIAQEAVNNAIKHGQAKKINIRLDVDAERMVLSIQDNGQGWDQPLAAQKGLGLNIMRYRANLIGGSLDIRSSAKDGTTVTCQAPQAKTYFSANGREYSHEQ